MHAQARPTRERLALEEAYRGERAHSFARLRRALLSLANPKKLLAIAAAGVLWALVPPAVPATQAGAAGSLAPRVGVAHARSASECDAQCRADLERARQAAERYRDVAVAIGDGFVETIGCEGAAAGGVGIRYLNALRYDVTLDVTQPDFLLYMPECFDSVARRPVAVGYAVPAPLDDPGPAPVLFGQPFSGPIPGHGPLEPAHYELVVWLFSANRDGTFAGANPLEACDASGVLDSPDAGSAEGCYEVLGLFSAPAERVRRLGRIPEQFRLRGEDGGNAQLMLSTFHCEKVTVAGTGTETMFAELVALLDPPDYAGNDPCCSRYLLQEVVNNAGVVQWIQERGGLGPEVIAYSRELARSFDPSVCTADPDYAFSTPEYALRAATACHGSVDLPTSVRFWRESPGAMTELHFWAPIRFAAAEVQVEARPGTLLAELLGTSEPVRGDPGSLSVSWERGVLQINQRVGRAVVPQFDPASGDLAQVPRLDGARLRRRRRRPVRDLDGRRAAARRGAAVPDLPGRAEAQRRRGEGDLVGSRGIRPVSGLDGGAVQGGNSAEPRRISARARCRGPTCGLACAM